MNHCLRCKQYSDDCRPKCWNGVPHQWLKLTNYKLEEFLDQLGFLEFKHKTTGNWGSGSRFTLRIYSYTYSDYEMSGLIRALNRDLGSTLKEMKEAARDYS